MTKEQTTIVVISGITLLIGIYITKQMIASAAVLKPKSVDQLLQENS